MDKTTDEIKRHIDEERERLGENLSEIQDRFKNATNWKTYFNQAPGLLLGAAASGGVLLALFLGKSKRSKSGS